jgi:hypothetical protein
MTFHQGHIAQGHVAPWPVPGVRRASVRRFRSATRQWRRTARLVIAVLLGSIVLVGALELSLGLGSLGLADTVPAPAPSPTYAAAPAPVAPAAATLPAPPVIEALPGPLEPPARLP